MEKQVHSGGEGEVHKFFAVDYINSLFMYIKVLMLVCVHANMVPFYFHNIIMIVCKM